MEDIRNAINSLEITLIRHGNEGLITDVFSAKTLKMAIKALEKQAFFENEVSNIHGWFVDNKNSLLDSAMTVARDGFIESNTNDCIDQVDLDFIVEDIVGEIQKGILNVLSTYMGEYDA